MRKPLLATMVMALSGLSVSAGLDLAPKKADGPGIKGPASALLDKKATTKDALLVTMKPGRDETAASLARCAGDIEIDHIKELGPSSGDKAARETPKNYRRVFRIALTKQQRSNPKKVIEKLSGLPGVEAIEFDNTLEIETDPNDLYYGNGTQWALNGDNGINAPGAWSYTTGSSSVRVGIIDTGVANHNDLTANIAPGWDYFNGNSITSDDTHSHGTHVAGIIGAVGNNAIGISGVCWNISIVPMQCANEENRFPISTVVSAINDAASKWGTDEQIDIINYSVGGLGSSTAVRSAISNFPGLFVWAAGNDTADIDPLVEANGSFELDNIVSVGSLAQNGERFSSSNYSSSNENVSIFAPGAAIYSTVLNGSYGYKTGTSMAAPHVTGVAALMLSYHHHLSGSQLKSLLVDHSAPVTISIPNGEGGSLQQTTKKLDAASAVVAATSSHSYTDHYEYNNNKNHKAYCACGEYSLKPHAVQAGETYISQGHRYGYCVGCGALIDLGTTIIFQPAATRSMVTDNGSYVSEGGIYVLVEEDVPAYLAGTLTFHARDEASM